jgi:hypothetical protein
LFVFTYVFANSIRFQEDIIAVWNRDASDEVKKQRISDAMRLALDLPKVSIVIHIVCVCVFVAAIMSKRIISCCLWLVFVCVFVCVFK